MFKLEIHPQLIPRIFIDLAPLSHVSSLNNKDHFFQANCTKTGAGVLSKVLNWNRLAQGFAVLPRAAALAVGPAVVLEHTGLCHTLAGCPLFMLFMLFTLTGTSWGFAVVQFHPHEQPFGTMNVWSQVDVLLAALSSLDR